MPLQVDATQNTELQDMRAALKLAFDGGVENPPSTQIIQALSHYLGFSGPAKKQVEDAFLSAAAAFLVSVTVSGYSIAFDPSGQAVTQATLMQNAVTEISNSFLLDNEPNALGTTYTNTLVVDKITYEEWAKTAGGAKIRTIDYTYIGNHINTEVRKIYATNGVTVLAQCTLTYTYSGDTVTSVALVRNV